MRCHQQQQRATSAAQKDQFQSFCSRNLAPEHPRNLLTFISLFTLPDNDFSSTFSSSSLWRLFAGRHLQHHNPQCIWRCCGLYTVVPLLVCLVAQCLAFGFHCTVHRRALSRLKIKRRYRRGDSIKDKFDALRIRPPNSESISLMKVFEHYRRSSLQPTKAEASTYTCNLTNLCAT